MKTRWFVGLLAVLLLATGCGGESDASAGESESGLSGDIRIDGSSTVTPLISVAAEDFQSENPDVRVTVGTSGTGGGFEKFCNGETDFSMASREIRQEEIDVRDEPTKSNRRPARLTEGSRRSKRQGCGPDRRRAPPKELPS